MRPSSRPSRSTSGPPDEPRGRGAVCSMAPPIRRPARAAEAAARARDEARAWRAGRVRPGWRARTTGVPIAGRRRRAPSRRARRRPVSTATTARSRSRVGCPPRAPVSRRPSAKVTVTSSPRRLWALVSTWPARDHDARAEAPAAPEPDRRAGPTRSARPRDRVLNLVQNRHRNPAPSDRVTCKLQVTTIPPRRALPSRLWPQAATTPLAAALDSVGDRWTLLVVEALLDGPRRFGDLQDELPGIAPNVLTQRLRRLEGEGLVVAQPYSERPPRFVYELSAAGRELAGALRLLAGLGRPPPGGRRGARATPPAAAPSRRAGGARCASGRSTTTRPPTSTSPSALVRADCYGRACGTSGARFRLHAEAARRGVCGRRAAGRRDRAGGLGRRRRGRLVERRDRAEHAADRAGQPRRQRRRPRTPTRTRPPRPTPAPDHGRGDGHAGRAHDAARDRHPRHRRGHRDARTPRAPSRLGRRASWRRRRRARAVPSRLSVVGGRPPPLPLCLTPPALRLDPPAPGLARRLRRPPRPRHRQRCREARAQPLECQLAVAGLAARVLRHGGQARPDARHHPSPLLLAERGRATPRRARPRRARRSRSRAARPARRAAHPQLDLGQRYGHAARDAHRVLHRGEAYALARGAAG